MSILDGPLGALLGVQLGQTGDPKALVPGSPEGVHDAAAKLRALGDRFETVGDDLHSIRIPSWYGEASDAFWDKFTPEPGKWRYAADALREAADQLDKHAETLEWAQEQAAEAIERYRKGEHESAQARSRYHQENPQALPGDSLLPGLSLPGFVDPGESLRESARELLDNARRQLREVGDAVARAIDRCTGDEPDWLAKAADAVREHGLGSAEISQKLLGADGIMDSQIGKSWTKTLGDAAKEAGQDGSGLDWAVKLYEDEAGVSLLEAEIGGSVKYGPLGAEGTASASFLGAGAGYDFSLGPDGLKAGAHAEAYLAKLEAQGEVSLGPAALGASGSAMVGASADASATIGPQGANLHAEAFVGAKAEGEVHADIAGVGAGVKGEAWAGVGAEADVDLGMKDGKFTIGAEFGAALGVGGKLGFEVTIDPAEVIDTVGDAAEAVGDAAEAVGDTIGDAAGAVGDFFGF